METLQSLQMQRDLFFSSYCEENMVTITSTSRFSQYCLNLQKNKKQKKTPKQTKKTTTVTIIIKKQQHNYFWYNIAAVWIVDRCLQTQLANYTNIACRLPFGLFTNIVRFQERLQQQSKAFKGLLTQLTGKWQWTQARPLALEVIMGTWNKLITKFETNPSQVALCKHKYAGFTLFPFQDIPLFL